MTSLTQIDISCLEEVSSDVTKTIVAYHRLHRISAVYSLGQNQFDFFECKSIFELRWQRLGSWKVIDEFKTIIGVLALESYDVFAFIGNSNNGTDILLIAFDGKVRLRQTISQRKDAVCVDYNQKTRDFFIGYENGSLMCVFTNCSAKFEYSLTVKRVIKVHSEKSQPPKQILTQDFMGLLFILTNEGNILCIDGTKFELVYSISRTAFSLIPSRVYCDKFGTDFLVRLHNSEKSKEQLECWHPPEDYASCRAGRFERFVIPLTAPIVGLSFESVGLYSGRTLLEIFTRNKKLQLWSCFGSTSVNLEAEITLNIPPGIWKQYFAIFGSDILQQISQNTIKDSLFINLDHYSSISSHMSSLQETLKFSSILLTNICQLATAIGIHLPDKKDTELNMQYIDMEISKYGVAVDQEDLSQFQQQALPIPRQFTYNSDDESSIMSETLIGALSNLAEVNRSIDERISQSQSLTNYENHTHNDSLSSVQLTNEVTFEDTISIAPQYPNLHDVTLSGVRRDSTVPSAPLSSRDLPSFLVSPQAGVAPPSQPDFSTRKLSAKPSNLSDLMLSDYNALQSKPAPYRELAVIKFVPTFFLHNQDTCKCDPNYSNPYSMVRFLEPDGMLMNDYYRLFAFSHEGLSPLIPKMSEKKLEIKFHSLCYRSGFLSVVSNQKDCLIYDMRNINILPVPTASVPLRVVLTIKNHVKVTAVASADIFLRTPPLPSTHATSGGHLKKKDKSSSSGNKDQFKFSEPVLSKYLMIVVGDSDGYIHIYISDSNHTILQTESFLAHQSASIKQILFTGDATRSLWQVGIDYLPGSNKLVLQTLGGSSILTASSEGEVKVWQPFSMEMNLHGSKSGAATISSSVEKFFQCHHIRWKISGVFVVDRTYSIQNCNAPANKMLTLPNTSANSRNSSKPPTAPGSTSKKFREMVSMTLLPSCLNLLISFSNGTIEEWNIPGLLDTNEATLATSQKEIWSNFQSHSEDIISARVYVHGPLSTIKQVHFIHDHERDSMLAKLATFVRIPNRMKTTIGLSFQEMKLLAISSSLTTCSKDSSIVLWGFNSSFFGHCSYLIPVPVRKFYFSSSPAQGLCYALSITNGQYHLGNINWKVDAIISGKVQSVVFTTRDSLFGSLSSLQTTTSNSLGKAAEMLTDYRADYGHKKAFIRFEDEILDPFGSKDDVDEISELKNKMIMGIPVISPVFKAQYLVNGYQVYNSIYDPFRLGVIPSAEQNFHDVSAQLIQNPNLLSTNLLEEWGKVEPVSHNPVISTVHVTDRPPTAVKSSVREMDSSIIPEFIENSHRSYDEYLADISSRPRSNLSSRGDSAFRRTRSLSPVIIKVPSFDRLENLKEAIESEGDVDGMMSGRKKVLVQGIMVEVESNLDLKEFEQSIQNRKFVLERTPPVSPEKPLIPLTKGEKILVKESRNETPVDGEQAKLLQTPKKVAENKKLGVEEDGDVKSAASERTRLSIAAVSFTKDSKVVRTISFDADEVVADTVSPNKQKADDETSVASDITQDEPKKPHKGLALNKAMELRQKMQEQLKERLELREKRGSNIYGGDARQTLKKVYTSKTSLQKQDLLHIQKGAKQPTSNAAINNLPPSRVIIQRPGIKGNSQSPTKLQEEEDLRIIRQTVPPPTKYVVVKQKDDTATKLTHQLIVAKTKYYKERSSRNGDESEGSLSGNGFFYESDENIGAANSDNRIEFEDESNSQLDLDSTGFSLSIDTNVRLEDGFKKDNDSPSRRKSPLALSENNTIKSPVLAAMNIPAVLAKTQSLEIDLPDLRKDKRRKYALAISQNMSLRNLERADELANIISKTAIFDEENEDLDDVSIVTHYFDRNAKPIFVDRGKPPKQVLKKRNQKVGKGMGSRSRSGDEDDGEWIEDENAIQEMNATLLDMYLDELSPEERKMFENLDEEAKQKLLRELRLQMGAGKRKNNKTKDLFKKLTKMATEQARLHAILSMELTLETTEVTDETLSVSITTNQKGPIAVVLTYSKNRFTPTKEDFYSSTSILNLPGYLEHRSIVFDRDNFEEITFRNLHPETSYTVFATVDKSNHAHFPMTDEVNEEEEEEKNKLIKPPKSITLKSLEEKLEIEWNRLDLEQRTIELRAAIRSEFVQMKSFYNYPIILLPTDEEILESNFQTLISPTISENDYHNLKSQRFQSNSSLKHIPTFLDWWIGHSKVTSKTRSSFHEIEAFYATLNKKIQKSMEEDRLFSNTREMNTLIEFSKSNIKHRARLNREVDPEDNLLLAGIPQINAESTDLSDDRLSLFKRFRSWYKGGFVIKEKEIKLARLQSGSGSTRSIVSPISSPKPVSISRVASFTLSKSRSSDSKDNQNNVEALLPEHSQLGDDNVAVSIVTSQKRRLQERTIFLRSLLEPVDVCSRQIQKLYEQYGLVKSMAFRLNDLSTSRRNSITSKDANAIMSAKKFLDLCIVRHMLSKNVLKYEEEPFPDIALNTLNPFNALKRTKSEAAVAITPKTLQKTYPIPMVIQRIAGVDLFRPVHVNTLKPDEPPPLALKCLPGTTRRPNKPWQSLSKQEQELEMTLACALDSIWELAVIDNVPVPNPEDRLLSSTEFPLKALIWENFRKWYAGEEEIDPIPGQGVPTVARVIFSEQLEMPQVERDSFVADMMEDQAFPLPLSYYSKNGATSARSNRGQSEENGNSSDLDERDEDETNLIEEIFSASKSKSSVRSMRQAYEKAISAAAGAQIRSDLMVELLSHYLHSRLMNMMKYLWPPGLKRMGLQYLYPRSLSFYYPKFSLPLHRFHLFPSRSRVTYNREEILAWYNVLEMQEDDQLMIRAEKKGVKQRAYHEWLTLEPQRQIYSRTQMAIEDSIAYQHRELHLLLEKRWKHHEERLTQLDEDIDTGEYNPKDRTRTKTSMLNLTPREMRSVKQNLVSDLVEEDDDTEISENDEDQNENNSDDLSIEGPEDKKREDKEDEMKKEEKTLRGKKLESRGYGRAETASSSAFSSPRYPTKSPRLINITPRTDMSREYSEIAFPATESTTHEPVSGIPPAVQNLLSPELLDSQTEEFKAYISEHLSTIEQDELSTALAMFDRARGIGGLQTIPINEELAANFINSNQMNFRVLNNLPQEYWYIFEESFEFKNGSGIYNDDEVEAERLLQEERARKAIDDALEFQRILEFEKKKREQEELARLRREEQDRRLREGMVRRRKLREHLEELKQQRIQRRKEEEEARLKAIEDERLAKVEEEQRIALEKYLQFLEEERCREISLMESEEIYMRDLKVRHRELKFMEHEDILSFLVEQMNVQYEMAEKERIKELEELYTPFEPYQFKQSRLPALERVLTYADDLNYDEEASFGEDEEYLQSLDGGKSSYSLVTSPSAKHAISSNISPSKRKNEKLLARMPPAELPYSNTGRSLDFNSPTKTKKKKFNTLPIPITHDPSIISFQSIVKQDHPTTMNQKMNHVKNTDVKTSDHQPTKKKIRKFFDITKLSVENLSKPLNASIHIDNTKSIIQRIDGDLSDPYSNVPAVFPHSPAKVDSAKEKIEEIVKTAPILPFNPYDTQWELQKSPPLTLSNLPFFIRPSSHGLNPFRSHSEQALSTPNLVLPLSSHSKSRPFSATSPGLQLKSASNRGFGSSSKPNSSTGGRLLSPIDLNSLQNPEIAIPVPNSLTGEDNRLSSVGSRSSYSPLSLEREKDREKKPNFHVQLAIKEELTPTHDPGSSPTSGRQRQIIDDSDLASHHTKQTMETYESEYNKTTEVTVDYINSLLAETKEKTKHENEILARYSEDELQFIQSLASSKSLHLGSKAYHQNPLLAGDALSSASLSLEKQVVGAGLGETSLQTSLNKSKVAKNAVSLVPEMVEKTNSQKEWLEYLSLQQKLTTASLSTIDTQEKEKLKKILGRGGILPISAQLANQTIKLPSKQRNDVKPSIKSKKKAGEILSSTMPNLSSSPSKGTGLSTSASTSAIKFQNSAIGLDYKTFQLAQTASEEVIRLKEQKELLKQYISGHAMLEEEQNEYYLLACQPGIQSQTILQKNASVQKFAQEIDEFLKNSDHTKGVSATVTAVNTAESVVGSEDDENTITTAGGGGAADKGEDEEDDYRARSNATSPTSLNSRKKKSKSLIYQPTSVGISSIPPPLAKKPFLSTSTSKLLTQVVPSTLTAHVTPLLSRKDPVPVQKKRSQPPIQMSSAEAAMEARENEEAALLKATSALNPFIMGNKITIAKESKKDILAKSKQLLLSSNNNASNKSSTNALPPKPTIRAFVRPNITVNTSNDDSSSAHNKSTSTPQSGMYESSVELKTGRSLDLFIRTPRVDGKSLELENHHTSDSHDEVGLVGSVELERSASDLSSFNHQLPDEEKSITA